MFELLIIFMVCEYESHILCVYKIVFYVHTFHSLLHVLFSNYKVEFCYVKKN